jgi:hypothetical protein
VRRRLEKINLAVGQRIGRGLHVRHADPLVALDLHHLAAGKAVGRLLPSHVGGIALINGAAARLEFARHEAERTGADELGDRLFRRLLRQPLRHDEGNDAGGLGQRLQHLSIRRFQHQLEAALVDDLHLGEIGHHPRAHGVALAPALQRGNDVGRGDGRAVMEGEARSQLEGVDEAARRHFMALHHLRTDLEFGIHGEQRVVDVQSVITAGPGDVDHRIGGTQRRMHHGADGLAGLGAGDVRHHAGGKDSTTGLEKRPAARDMQHDRISVSKTLRKRQDLATCAAMA